MVNLKPLSILITGLILASPIVNAQCDFTTWLQWVSRGDSATLTALPQMPSHHFAPLNRLQAERLTEALGFVSTAVEL